MIINDKSLGAEEKIKQLVDSEDAKRKELEEKKKELEEKKKELEQLEGKRKQEINDTRTKIEEQIEELAIEEKQRFEELEELRRRREAEAASLEETVEEEERKGRIRRVGEAPQQRGYGEAVEEILRGNPTVYDITNYNVMNQLERIAREARERPLSTKERNFVDLVEYHAERMKDNDFYRNKDPANYMTRELDRIDQINRMARENEKEKPGDYKT
jgi:DNA repair exonuclease SbcCD ATPase subunit